MSRQRPPRQTPLQGQYFQLHVEPRQILISLVEEASKASGLETKIPKQRLLIWVNDSVTLPNTFRPPVESSLPRSYLLRSQLEHVKGHSENVLSLKAERRIQNWIRSVNHIYSTPGSAFPLLGQVLGAQYTSTYQIHSSSSKTHRTLLRAALDKIHLLPDLTPAGKQNELLKQLKTHFTDETWATTLQARHLPDKEGIHLSFQDKGKQVELHLQEKADSRLPGTGEVWQVGKTTYLILPQRQHLWTRGWENRQVSLWQIAQGQDPTYSHSLSATELLKKGIFQQEANTESIQQILDAAYLKGKTPLT